MKSKEQNVIYDFSGSKYSSLTQKKHRVKGCTDSFRLKYVLLCMMYSDIGKNGPLFADVYGAKKFQKEGHSGTSMANSIFCTDLHIANSLQVEKITIQAF